jgi:MFS family permease
MSVAPPYRHESGPSRRDLRLLYAIEAMTSVGANLLLLGIYFYTKERLGWSLMHNFLLATGQGAVYVVGSLMAHGITERLGRRRALVGIYATMAVLAGVGLMVVGSPVWVTVLLLLYTLVTSFNWPVLESMVSTGADAHVLSRRIGVYNLWWSGAGALALGSCGVMIKYAPSAVFLVPVGMHVMGAILMLFMREPAGGAAGGHGHLDAEPALVPVRRLALALSRVSLPATYVVIYSLMSMLPSLEAINELSPVVATAVGSLWMGVRWVTFLVLGATAWWHARPRILVGAAIAMAGAFLGIVLPAGRLWLWQDASVANVLAWVVAAQVVLGVSVGVIYAASLYFGMVLSEGSTEHGGYHEALIGLGSGLGPAAGAVAAYWWPGDVTAGVAAVTAVVGLSVAATAATPAFVVRKRAAGSGGDPP